jgi:hypothetical protein
MTMRCHGCVLLVLLSLGVFATEAWALLIPFSKERIAAQGKHCVHGFDGNFGHVGVYYAGDAAALNESIKQAAKVEKELAEEGKFASKTVILHPGSMAVPNYVSGRDDLATDWQVSSWRGEHKGKSGWHVQIDVWLGRLKLDEVQIPEGFAVESGREIEDFVERRKSAQK